MATVTAVSPETRPPTYTLRHHRQKKCFELRKEQSSAVILQRQQRSLRTHQVVLPRQLLVAFSSGIQGFPNNTAFSNSRSPAAVNCHLFFFNIFIYLFIYFIFGCVGSLLLCVAFLLLRRAGTTLRCGAQASHCGGFSCCRARALGSRASVGAARRLSSCGARA